MKRSHYVLLVTLLGLLCAAFSLPAFALDLQSARTQGLVAEKQDGYVKAIKGGSAAEQLAADVNERRKREYLKISKDKGQAPDVVAKLAAEQIIGQLPPGALYEGDDGAWKTR